MVSSLFLSFAKSLRMRWRNAAVTFHTLVCYNTITAGVMILDHPGVSTKPEWTEEAAFLKPRWSLWALALRIFQTSEADGRML